MHILKGVYHSTSSGGSDLHLIELENPRNKPDLLRLSDRYGNSIYKRHSDKAGLEQLEPVSIGINALIRSYGYGKV